MNYIVFDLEWNQPYSNDISFMKRTKMPLTGEIIQIGAVKHRAVEGPKIKSVVPSI